MSDAEQETTKKRKPKLPPISSLDGNEDGEQKKPVRKKKKKAPSEATNGSTTPSQATDGTPRKKKIVKKKDDENTDKPTPKKRKKKEEAVDKEDDPTSARSTGSKTEDVTGSKASLISKDTKGTGTPKKKVRKKKKAPSTTATPRTEEDEWADTLTAELNTIQEDIVIPDDKKDEDDVVMPPYSTESAVLKSQPLEKLFIETDRGFKGENKVKFAKKWAEEEAIKEIEPEQQVESTILFALGTHRVFITACLFLHGLTAGIAMWHITMTYVLLYNTELDFLEHYRVLALPVQCMFYILLVLCTVSACDRFDIGSPNRRFVLQSFTLQTGTVSILIYFVSLILSLCIANLEDKMNLYDRYKYLWVDTSNNNTPLPSLASDIKTWTEINTARCCMAILAWIVLSITSTTDRFSQNLTSGEENFLGDSVDLGKQQV